LGSHILIIALASFGAFVIIATGVVLVLWIATPFSIFGVKGLLQRLIQEQARTNSLLEGLAESLRKMNGKDSGQGNA
jgi:hypothetical protein